MAGPMATFDYTSKAKVIPSTLKGGALIAGGLLLFNVLVDKPVVGDVLVGYRKTMHKLFKFVGGKDVNPQWLDAGAMSFVDGLSILGATLFAGRTGMFKGKQTPTHLDDLGPDGPKR